jgi:hypothetical protein
VSEADEGQGEPTAVTPGTAVERVPLKVVPYFVDPQPDAESVTADAEPEPVAPERVVVPRRRRAVLGILSLVFAVLTAVAQVVAIVVASDGDLGLGTLLGYGAIGLSVVAVGLGVAVLVRGPGRRWAVAGILLGILANPWVLLWLLTAVGG